uniref:MFS domain-containing protein n=1 Tax=Syphacia muris TaxID=451379 RepID=A0A0N5AMZ4_9BILA
MRSTFLDKPSSSKSPLNIPSNNQPNCDSSTKLRPADSILKDIGWRNVYVLRIALLASLSWALAAMSIMCSAFYITTNENSSISNGSTFFLIKNVTSSSSTYDAEYLKKVADYSTSLFMFGNMIGATILTYASDKVGRKPIMVIAMICLALTGFIALFGDQIVLLPYSRFLQGICTPGLLLLGWVLAYECTPVSFRAYASLIFGCLWVIGYCVVALIAYCTPNWILITITCTAPSAITGILFAAVLPESLHFLVIKKKVAKVKKWINEARKFETKRIILNAEEVMYASLVEVDDKEKFLEETAIGSSKSQSRRFVDELTYNRVFFAYLFIFAYLWTCDTFIYYGLSLYTTKLVGNAYWNYALSGLIELPVYILTPVFLERYGRKPIVSVTHFVAGAVLIAYIFVQDSSTIAKLLYIIGKFSISCSFICIFVYSSEVFPTTIRSGCVGACTIIARIGGVLSPYVGVLAVFADFVPVLFFGSLSVLAATLTLLLPETRKQALPSSLVEIKKQRNEESVSSR